MRQPVSRRFTILDALVLVAATAGALAWLRCFPPLSPHEMIDIFRGPAELRVKVGVAFELSILAIPFGVMGTLALLVLRLRPPRPNRRRLSREPGLVASGTVLGFLVLRSLGIALGSLILSALTKQSWSEYVDEFKGLGEPQIVYEITARLGVEFGVVVATAWLLLALSGRWRPERHWIDRAGRLAGVFWIMIFQFCSWMDQFRM